MRQIIERQKQEKEQVIGSDFVRRDVTEKIDTYLQQDIIKVVTGVRRSGKSIFCDSIILKDVVQRYRVRFEIWCF